MGQFEGIIWAPGGAWLQTNVAGVVRSSYVGQVPLMPLEIWCNEKGIKLVVWHHVSIPSEAVQEEFTGRLT